MDMAREKVNVKNDLSVFESHRMAFAAEKARCDI